MQNFPEKNIILLVCKVCLMAENNHNHIMVMLFSSFFISNG